jgi:hypothetical protein
VFSTQKQQNHFWRSKEAAKSFFFSGIVRGLRGWQMMAKSLEAKSFGENQ